MAKTTGRKKEEAQEYAAMVIKDNQPRDRMFRWMNDAFKNKWTFPREDIPDWMHVSSSSDPRDAVQSGSNILSTTAPKITYQPLSDSDPDKKNAGVIEKTLKWNYLMAEKRRHNSSVTKQIAKSALLYSAVCAQVNYLPFTMKGMSESRRRMAMRKGSFNIVVRNPLHVYPKFSDNGLEEVLFARIWDATKFKGWRGEKEYDRLNKMWNRGRREPEQLKWIYVYDLHTHEDRYAWAKPVADNKEVDHKGASEKSLVLIDEKHGMPFLNWVVKYQGAEFMDDIVDQLEPLLDPVYQGGHWDTQNVLLTILTSRAISLAMSPIGASETLSGEGVEVDYDYPATQVKLRTGEKWTALPPPMLDQGQAELLDRYGAMLGKATVAEMLQNPQARADVPYSAMNLIYQLGANTLNPFKALGEAAIEELLTHMMYWVDYTGDSIYAYGTNEAPGGDFGAQYSIKKGDFDPNQIFLSVKLTADVPTDKLQKVNAGVMMANPPLNYPARRTLEEIGVEDPDIAMLERRKEIIEDAHIEGERSKILAKYQLEIQAMAQAAMQAMQAGQQAGQRASGGGGGGEATGKPPGPAPGPAGPEQAIPGGLGFNTGQGGLSPANAAPELTREVVKGQSLKDRVTI